MAKLDKSYFRAAHKSQFPNGVWEEDGETPVANLLHGDISPRTFESRGRSVTRVDWEKRDGFFIPGAGTSLHDFEGAFGTRSHAYFELPIGTEIPQTLVVIQRGSDPHHYQIEVRVGGEINEATLRGALDNLARNCAARAKQQAETGET